MDNKTYLSVLTTENYLSAIKCLYFSLKQTNTKYPFTVLINSNISNKTENELKKIGINVIKINKINIDERILQKNNDLNRSYWNNTFDKLEVFSLTQFSKIVCLDADMYIRKNIDELFEKENFSAVVDKRYIPINTADWMKLNSGTMVIEPKKDIMKEFSEILEELMKLDYPCGDQDVIQLYDKQWDKKEKLHLDTKYNLFFPFLDFYINKKMYDLDSISIIHFVYAKKPWNYEGENRIDNYINDLNETLYNSYKKHNFQELEFCAKSGNDGRKKILEEYYKILDRV